MILAITFVFLLMGILFESFILPLSIIVSIPFAFIGVYWLLYLTDTTFEIMAGIGLITSTFLTLFVVPLFYTYFDDLRIFFRVVMARAVSRGAPRG